MGLCYLCGRIPARSSVNNFQGDVCGAIVEYKQKREQYKERCKRR